MISDKEISSEYFIGSYSPFILFEYEFHNLNDIAGFHQQKERLNKSNPALEICMIGIISHFEAFFKHTFAAITNIYPSVLHNFSNRRADISFYLHDILAIKDDFQKSLSFLVTEKQDFGSAKKINSLFQDLIKVTPFTTDECSKFDTIIKNRNLIVHHGGVFTFNYVKSETKKIEVEKIFRDRLPIQLDDFLNDNLFLLDIVVKLTLLSVKFLESVITKEDADYINKKRAIELLTVGILDNLI